MPSLTPRLAGSAGQSALAAALARLRIDLGVPEHFPAEVLAEAQRAADAGPDRGAADLTGIDLCTIDPAGSTDLDQALHLARDREGLLVHYAIADVPWFVRPGGAVDAEARRRGQTLYAPDGRAPLHPPTLSEDAASLLPGRDRQAFVWEFSLDRDHLVRAVSLRRGVVRSRRQWSYQEAQAAVDSGTAPESLALLLPFGAARERLEAERGGASLNLPSTEIVLTERGYALRRRTPLPIEDANAQLSLMTGMAAARIMLDAGVGILRTMPPADRAAVAEFRQRTRLLGLPWPDSICYGDYLRGLDRRRPEALAVLRAATSLFRGAGYAAFDGAPPEQSVQAAIAAPYAHVTAPLRRLVDRFALVACCAAADGRPVPDWARRALPEVPALMAASDELAARLEAGTIDRVEAALVSDRAHEVFEAVVLSRSRERARIQLTDPPVGATVAADRAPGDRIRVRVQSADIATGRIEFTVVG